MKKRTRIEIIIEILNLCKEPRAKTRLLRKASLSWHQGNRYLDNMLSLGLLEIRNSPITYATTKKGDKLLARWKSVAETIQATHHF